MTKFILNAKHKPAGGQQKAIDQIVNNLQNKAKNQVLLGATGTGKTFVMANVIEKANKPTLILAHNKTLAGQLYSELKSYFPKNKVEYFISYFDYYQPESYIPSKDIYFEKQSIHNKEIEIMRLSTIASLIQRKDVIVVASVAAIYPSSDPEEYIEFKEILKVGMKVKRNDLLRKFVKLGYKRNDFEFAPSNFSVKGDTITICPSWTEEYYLRIDLFDDEIETLNTVEIITKQVIEKHKVFVLTPAEEMLVKEENIENAIVNIEKDLKERIKYFKSNDKLLEAQRIEQRTKFDLEQLKEFGMCSGIENYSIYFEPKRKAGEAPYTLFDYLGDDFLTIIDESHITLPQIRGMYEGDRSRKQTLVDFGFRLPKALDNRPLKLNEFESKLSHTLYVSATPDDYEINKSNKLVTELIIRPTYLVDPIIEIKKTKNQIDDIIEQIHIVKKRNERVFINTVTIKLAEDLASYISSKGLNVAYLHSELKTFERNEVIRKLRLGIYDAIVGINLLKEGLDVPEVSLMLILDADKEGFLRNKRSLIQIIGRAARNVNGKVIMYADKTSQAMLGAIEETNRRREIQLEYNKKNKITPKTIIKDIPRALTADLEKRNFIKLPKDKLLKQIQQLEKEMMQASKNYDFEKAIEYRDLIIELKTKL